jgi:hypothetical protein
MDSLAFLCLGVVWVGAVALITQFRFGADMCRECWMLGMATIMIVPSSTTMNRAMAMTHEATPSRRPLTAGTSDLGVVSMLLVWTWLSPSRPQR